MNLGGWDDLPFAHFTRVLSDPGRQKGYALHFGGQQLTDLDQVLEGVRRNGLTLQFAKPEMRGNRQVVLEAVQHDGHALEHASQELRADRGVVLAAVQQHGSALEYAHESFRSDSEVVLEAVRSRGIALELASPDLRDNRDIVLEAVNQDGNALQFAGEAYRKEREVVLAAVRRNGTALEFAHQELRADREVVFEALRQYSGALQFAFGEIATSKEEVFDPAVASNIRLALPGTPGRVCSLSVLQPRYSDIHYRGELGFSGHEIEGYLSPEATVADLSVDIATNHHQAATQDAELIHLVMPNADEPISPFEGLRPLVDFFRFSERPNEGSR